MLSQSITSGFLLVNKPAGITSHDVIDRLRNVTGVQRIGHSGTLDPFATGLLIVGIGRESTRELGRFLKMDKQYRAMIHLGATSITGDPTGIINPKSEARHRSQAGSRHRYRAGSRTLRDTLRENSKQIQNSKSENRNASDFEDSDLFRVSDFGFRISEADIQRVLCRFVGLLQQIPPMHSAKKVGGKKLYQLARRGKTIDRSPISISISNLTLVSYSWPLLTIDIRCSSGTYIRTLAEDIGRALGCGAYCQRLERTGIGPYRLQNAVELDMITRENWNKLLQQRI